ncbi:MAG: hypothetical protein ACR2OM_00140, partial [Aestuariivirgaceae bacterium]
MKQDGDDRAGAAGHWVVAVLAPGLVLLAIAVEFLSFHNYSLVLPESLLLMGAALATGGLLGAVSLVWPASQPLLMALALALFISRFSLFELFHTWFGHALSGILGAPDILAVFYVVLIVASSAVCLLVRKHLAIIVTVAFGTIIASSAIFPAGTKAVASRTAAGGPELNDLPPVIHVILDGQIGIGGLSPDIADARQAADMMRQVYRDFEVHERGYSLFTRTEDSVTSLMNGELSTGVETLLDRTGGARRMRTNKWFDQLRSQGYAIRV